MPDTIIPFPVNLDTVGRRAITDARTSAAPALVFTQGDTYLLQLIAWKPAPADTPFDLFVPAKLKWDTLKAGILRVDAAPTGGTWKVRVGTTSPQTTPELRFDLGKGELQTALNNLTNVAAAGGVKVVQGGARNIYRFLWNEPDNALAVEVVENKLTPHCFDRVNLDENTPGKVVVKVFQSPYAFADEFENPLPPECIVETVVTGNGTRNEVQRLIVPAGASGQFAFTSHGRGLIPIAEVTAARIADTLNAPYLAALSSDRRFAVRNVATGVYDIEFIGAFAASDQDPLAVEMFDQVALETPEALLALTGPGIEEALDGAPEVTLIFEVTAVDSAGKETTLCHQPCLVVNDGLDGEMSSDTPKWKKPAEEAAQAEAEDEKKPIIYGSMAWRGALGDGEQIGDEFRVWDIVHGLGTLDPFPVVFNLVTRRRLKPYVEFDAEAIDNGTCRLTFPVAVGGGDISITIVNFAAQAVLNDHEHPWTKIYKLLDNGTKQYLPDLFDELLNALPDDWPNVPGSKIADGSVKSEKLDLASLIAALRDSALFLDLLRSLIKDPTLITNLFTEFTSNEALGDTFNNFIAAVRTAILADPDLVQLVREVVVSVLQSGVTLLPAGSTVFAVPDFELLTPTPQSAPAPATRTPLAENVEVQAIVGGTTTKTNGAKTSIIETPGTRVIYAELAPSLWNTAAAGGDPLSGKLANTSDSLVHTVAGDGAESVSTAGIRRRGETFLPGEKIALVNGFWQRVVAGASGTKWHPTESEQTVWDLEVGEDSLWAGTQLAVNWVLQAQLLGGPRGRVWLIVEQAPFDPTGGEQQALTWAEVFSERIAITSAMGFHSFGLEVARNSGDALSGKIRKAGKETTFTPSAKNLALRARLAKFTVISGFSNDTPARGALLARMRGALASIAPI
jgi:hypothetical protein